jgi:hypothetical protein
VTNIDFPQWRKEHPSMEQILEKENSRWGRIICKWTEKKEVEESQDPVLIEHLYASTINLKNADMYLDCRPRKIWAKFTVYSIFQPIVLTAKTFYHLILPISIPYIIYKTVRDANNEQKDKKTEISGRELAKRIFKEIGKNILDIGRTPLYAIVLTVIGISALIIGPLAPKILHDFRRVAGNVEKSLNWGNADSAWIIFKCFQPIENLMTVKEWSREYPDTSYYPQKTKNRSILKGLANFARAQIKFRRENRALFNDCFLKYSQDKPYKSAYLK